MQWGYTAHHFYSVQNLSVVTGHADFLLSSLTVYQKVIHLSSYTAIGFRWFGAIVRRIVLHLLPWALLLLTRPIAVI